MTGRYSAWGPGPGHGCLLIGLRSGAGSFLCTKGHVVGPSKFQYSPGTFGAQLGFKLHYKRPKVTGPVGCAFGVGCRAHTGKCEKKVLGPSALRNPWNFSGCLLNPGTSGNPAICGVPGGPRVPQTAPRPRRIPEGRRPDDFFFALTGSSTGCAAERGSAPEQGPTCEKVMFLRTRRGATLGKLINRVDEERNDSDIFNLSNVGRNKEGAQFTQAAFAPFRLRANRLGVDQGFCVSDEIFCLFTVYRFLSGACTGSAMHISQFGVHVEIFGHLILFACACRQTGLWVVSGH